MPCATSKCLLFTVIPTSDVQPALHDRALCRDKHRGSVLAECFPRYLKLFPGHACVWSEGLVCGAGHCVILQNRYEEGEVAWDIIRKGPERLQSQFAAGYGMVLNLLYSRSLAEAKAFIDRSFNSYLSKLWPQLWVS